MLGEQSDAPKFRLGRFCSDCFLAAASDPAIYSLTSELGRSLLDFNKHLIANL